MTMYSSFSAGSAALDQADDVERPMDDAGGRQPHRDRRGQLERVGIPLRLGLLREAGRIELRPLEQRLGRLLAQLNRREQRRRIRRGHARLQLATGDRLRTSWRRPPGPPPRCGSVEKR